LILHRFTFYGIAFHSILATGFFLDIGIFSEFSVLTVKGFEKHDESGYVKDDITIQL